MFFLTPRYIKEAKQYLQGAKKFLAYKRDILAPSRVTEIEAAIEELRAAMRQRSREAVAKQMRSIDELIGKSVPPVKNPGLRENIEVLVVAIVFAAGVKAYFSNPSAFPLARCSPRFTELLACRLKTRRRTCLCGRSISSCVDATTSTSAPKKKMSWWRSRRKPT